MSVYTYIPEASAAILYKNNGLFSVNAGMGFVYPIIRNTFTMKIVGSSSTTIIETDYGDLDIKASAGISIEPYSGLAFDVTWFRGYYDGKAGIFTVAVRIYK